MNNQINDNSMSKNIKIAIVLIITFIIYLLILIINAAPLGYGVFFIVAFLLVLGVVVIPIVISMIFFSLTKKLILSIVLFIITSILGISVIYVIPQWVGEYLLYRVPAKLSWHKISGSNWSMEANKDFWELTDQSNYTILTHDFSFYESRPSYEMLIISIGEDGVFGVPFTANTGAKSMLAANQNKQSIIDKIPKSAIIEKIDAGNPVYTKLSLKEFPDSSTIFYALDLYGGETTIEPGMPEYNAYVEDTIARSDIRFHQVYIFEKGDTTVTANVYYDARPMTLEEKNEFTDKYENYIKKVVDSFKWN